MSGVDSTGLNIGLFRVVETATAPEIHSGIFTAEVPDPTQTLTGYRRYIDPQNPGDNPWLVARPQDLVLRVDEILDMVYAVDKPVEHASMALLPGATVAESLLASKVLSWQYERPVGKVALVAMLECASLQIAGFTHSEGGEAAMVYRATRTARQKAVVAGQSVKLLCLTPHNAAIRVRAGLAEGWPKVYELTYDGRTLHRKEVEETGGSGGAEVREPRRPAPQRPSGAVQLEQPGRAVLTVVTR